METVEPFNPLHKKNLGISVAEAMLQRSISKLTPIDKFGGAGIYAIYYCGNFPPYQPISDANRNSSWTQPIYVGKAIPEGARKGGLGLDAPAGNVLYKRLSEHAKSIEQASNLNIDDFFCRYLVVDDIWIPLGESLLIETYRPLWNVVIDGFGNHDPGSGRYQQQKSPWDTIHPGRDWAMRCQPGKTEDIVFDSIEKYFLSR
jgi:hypothetical protein